MKRAAFFLAALAPIAAASCLRGRSRRSFDSDNDQVMRSIDKLFAAKVKEECGSRGRMHSTGCMLAMKRRSTVLDPKTSSAERIRLWRLLTAEMEANDGASEVEESPVIEDKATFPRPHIGQEVDSHLLTKRDIAKVITDEHSGVVWYGPAAYIPSQHDLHETTDTHLRVRDKEPRSHHAGHGRFRPHGHGPIPDAPHTVHGPPGRHQRNERGPPDGSNGRGPRPGSLLSMLGFEHEDSSVDSSSSSDSFDSSESGDEYEVHTFKGTPKMLRSQSDGRLPLCPPPWHKPPASLGAEKNLVEVPCRAVRRGHHHHKDSCNFVEALLAFFFFVGACTLLVLPFILFARTVKRIVHGRRHLASSSDSVFSSSRFRFRRARSHANPEGYEPMPDDDAADDAVVVTGTPVNPPPSVHH